METCSSLNKAGKELTSLPEHNVEARIEAHYVYKYEGGVEYGKSLTAKQPADCHTVLSLYITDLIGEKFGRTPAKSVKYACLPTDTTSVLTPSGWVQGKNVLAGDTVMGWNKASGKNEWTKVLKTHLFPNEKVLNKGNFNWKVESTPDHRWHGVSWKQSTVDGVAKMLLVPSVFTTGSELTTNNIINTAEFNFQDTSTVLPHQAALLGWILSDGYYKWSDKTETTSCSYGRLKGLVCSIAQANHKYQKDIEQVLSENGAEYVIDILPEKGMKIYRFKSAWIRDFLDQVVGSRAGKHEVDWTSWVLSLNKDAVQQFVHAFWLADGDSLNKGQGSFLTFKQNSGSIADALVVAGYMLGYNVTHHTSKKCGIIRFQRDRPHTTCQRFKVWSERETEVFCLTTELDSFVIKQGHIVTITGNCAYNAQPKRIAKAIGKPLNIGQIVFDAYWEQAKPLALFKAAAQKYWETTGQKKFIKGIDGRKIPIRSKGNCVNSAFQSAGVICAKRAMVIHEKKLREKGLIVDFFKDDWKNSVFSQQLIGYHDECEGEVSKSEVTIKTFKIRPYTEEVHTLPNGKIQTDKELAHEEAKALAQAYKDSQQHWSEVGHTDIHYYTGHCLAGALAVESVREAGEYYKLNVSLSAGYNLGRHWGQVH